MKKNNVLNNGIPVSVSLNPALEAENFRPSKQYDKKRMLFISAMAVIIAGCAAFIAKALVYLIELVTNISFYGKFSFEPSQPAGNNLGLWVILVPVLGGVVVGLMAMFGSKAIRGHGIPEAMEQILTNQSKIKPAITYLKPLSAAISIGTGGPFGAEGPIIASGGALGSTLGQLLKISHYERKVLLAAGATAGMSAIFGSPIAAIFLAIELLLFEFSAKSIIPVAMACITGAAGHHFLFDSAPVFGLPFLIAEASNSALLMYSITGLLIGGISILITKLLYFLEDGFEKLPVHWMWWPAIGGIAVGVVGYFEPRSLGVGYDNITDIISGSMTFQMIGMLCLMKFISWIVALSSGTSGGTLAPLLTIGGGAGALIGYGFLFFFPECGISLPLAALVGMSAMFAGASRALLTSIIFAMETTHQANALLPLLASCSASYFVSFFLMENTIMTEKIARRGVKTPNSYEIDILEKLNASSVIKQLPLVFSEKTTIKEVRKEIAELLEANNGHVVVNSSDGEFIGVIKTSDILNHTLGENDLLESLATISGTPVLEYASLRTAVEEMSRDDVDILPVVSYEDRTSIVGFVSYRDIISAYKLHLEEHEKKATQLNIRKGMVKLRQYTRLRK